MKLGLPVISVGIWQSDFHGLARVVTDSKTACEILKVCYELGDKLEALEKVFIVRERVE